MPYKDAVNEHVKRTVDSINRRFIAHTDMIGSTNAINSKNPSVEPQGQKLGLAGSGNNRAIGGGEGCANWSASSATKHYNSKTKTPEDMTGGAILGLQDGTSAGDMTKPIYSETKYSKPETDNTGQFGALGDAFAARMDAGPKGPTASNARSGYAHKDDSPLETQSVEKTKQMGMGRKKRAVKPKIIESDSDSETEMMTGRSPKSPTGECSCPKLKSGKAPKRCKCGFAKSGGNGFAAGTHMDTGLGGETLGISSKKKMKGGVKGRAIGGAILGLVKSPVAGKLDQTPAAYGNKLVGPTSTPKKSLDKPTTKADMPSSTLSGLGAKRRMSLNGLISPSGGKKVGGKRSERADIVKKIMRERGISLMAASSAVKKEGLYKAG